MNFVQAQDSLNASQLGLLHDYWESCTDITVVGDYAYCTTGYSGLRIVDISDSTSPWEVGYYDTPGSAERVAVSGNYAYVADYYSFRVVNISNPASPFEEGFYDTPGSAYGVAASGNQSRIRLRPSKRATMIL